MANGHGGKRAGAGRPKGAINKLSREFREEAAQYCKELGVNPIHKLIEHCASEDSAISLRAIECYVKHVYPTLKAQEFSLGAGFEPWNFVIDRTGEVKPSNGAGVDDPDESSHTHASPGPTH